MILSLGAYTPMKKAMSNIAKLPQDLDNKYLSRAYHTFFFYLNVKDKFRVEDDSRSPLTLRQYLVSRSLFGKSPFIIQFNISRGIMLQNERLHDLFLEVVMALFKITDNDAKKEFKDIFRASQKDPEFFFSILFKILRFSPEDLKTLNSGLYEHVYGDEPEPNISLFSIYINYLQDLMPSGSSSSNYSPNDRRALQSILEIAQSMKIRKSGNMVVLAGESLASVASQLGAETNSIACFKVEFPDREEREATYTEIKKKYGGNGEDLSPHEFSRLSSGMSTNVIVSFVSEHAHAKKPITVDNLFAKKKKIIDEESHGLMEVQRPLWGFEAIGGLEEHKAYALKVVKNMKDGKNLAVPMGIMLMGPPGTGKTVFAEAIAHAADIPFIKYKNLRSMWVGESERNLEHVMERSKAQQPMIGFFDEVDQQFQARGTVYHGDSGVNARMQGSFFEFISDTALRGKILWIAATNMPGSLDPAMLREGRFDDKIPFLPPETEERVNIFNALIIKNRVAADALKTEFRIGQISADEVRLFARMCFCRQRQDGLTKCTADDFEKLKRTDKEFSDAIYFTGGQMEGLITFAYSIALDLDEPLQFKHLKAAYDDYNPPLDMLRYEEFIRDAILHTNRLRFLPKAGRWKKFADRVLGQTNDDPGFPFTKDKQ